MPNENRPASPQHAPDPADSYERAKPENESVTGRLDSDKAPTSKQPDRQQDAAKNRQDPTRQVNGEGASDQRSRPATGSPAAPAASKPAAPQTSAAMPAPKQPDHSMHEEEPTGWDLAPTDIHDPQKKRHPRHEGKGGTP